MFCKNCGATISDVSKFCRSCGCPVVSMPTQPAPDPIPDPIPMQMSEPVTIPIPEPKPEQPKVPTMFTLDPIEVPSKYEKTPEQPAQNNFAQEPVNQVPNNFAQEPVNQAPNNFAQEPVNQVPNNFAQEPVNQAPNNFGQTPVNQVPNNFGQSQFNQTQNNFGQQGVNQNQNNFGQSAANFGKSAMDSATNLFNNVKENPKIAQSMNQIQTKMNNGNTNVQFTPLFWISLLLIAGISLFVIISGLMLYSDSRYYYRLFDSSGFITVLAIAFIFFPVIDIVPSFIIAKKKNNMSSLPTSFGGSLLAICILACIFASDISWSSSEFEWVLYLILYPYNTVKYFGIAAGVILVVLGVIDSQAQKKSTNPNMNFNNPNMSNPNTNFNNPNMSNPNQNYPNPNASNYNNQSYNNNNFNNTMR